MAATKAGAEGVFCASGRSLVFESTTVTPPWPSLEATKVEVNEEVVEGYHVCVGGGWGEQQGIGRRLFESMPFDEVPPAVERLLRHYLAYRSRPDELFATCVRRRSLDELREAAGVEFLASPETLQPV